MPKIKITCFPIFLYIFFIIVISACRQPVSQPPILLPTYTLLPSNTQISNILPPTWTPRADVKGSTVTPTPKPTWTPLATLTPQFTIPPSPTPYPPITPIELFNLPGFPGALYYLKDGLLLRLRDGNEEPIPLLSPDGLLLASGITKYSLTSDGSRALLTSQDQNGDLTLQVMDFTQQQLLVNIPLSLRKLIDARISPNGLYIAYSYIPLEDLGPDKLGYGLVKITSVVDPGLSIQLSECDPGCTNIMWNPDSSELFWGDDEGLWKSQIPLLELFERSKNQNDQIVQTITPTATNIVPTSTQTATEDIQSPEDKFPELLIGTENARTLGSGGDGLDIAKIISISPFGSYLLVEIQKEGENWVLVSLDEIKYEPLPGRFLFIDKSLSVSWGEDENLIIARAGLPGLNSQPAGLDIFSLNSGKEESLFTLENSIELGDNPREVPFGPFLLPNSNYAVSILDYNTPLYSEINGIYKISPDEEVSKLNDLPFVRVSQNLWAPDGSALMIISRLNTLYVPLDGGNIIDIRPVIGRNSCCFQWMP